jgi:phenylacetate-CoA ligase
MMTLAAETAKPSDGLAAALGATLQSIVKLKGSVTFAALGELPNDGKAIADERKYD